LMGVVALVLMAACTNLASLLLAHAAARRQEIATRMALGASRFRLIRQLLTESVLLAALGGVLGLLVAAWSGRALLTMVAEATEPIALDLGLDGRILLFTALLSVSTGVLFGLAPALKGTRHDITQRLKAPARPWPIRNLLVVAQVALSLLLVVGAGLFLRSLQNLATLPLGFEQDHVVSAWISPGTGAYREAELPALYQRLIESAEALPGVQSAAVAMCGLMRGCRSIVSGLIITGYDSQPGEQVSLQENRVGPKYFETVGMQIIEGRSFNDRDTDDSVAIVNETAVQRYFKNRSPIGQRFGEDTTNIEIVGVVRDARVNTVRDAVLPMAFHPLEPGAYIGTLEVRTAGEPRATAEALHKAIARVDPNLPLDRVTTMADQAGSTLRQERLIARLTTALGVLALGLACLGLYGVMSYGVKQRTSELGIRFALGASRPLVLWTVLRDSLVLIGIGVAVGVPLVLAASQILGTMLFEVSPSNPITLGVSVLLLLVVGASSGYVPAWRASRVDPITALRHD
ncbi:MAG: FtsX-like permease family protein, partial [Vicinamibacterales bacterium]